MTWNLHNFKLPLKMSSASIATMIAIIQQESLSISSFGSCNLRNPFLIALHQAPLDYSLNYCNSQTLFAHYRFDIKNCINNSNKNTLITNSKNIKKTILNDSLHISTIFWSFSCWSHFSWVPEYFSLLACLHTSRNSSIYKA